jgi:Family of unknown function (DUF5999)
MCLHQPQCPSADRPDRDAARIVAFHPEQGWSLLCNGVILFDDMGEILPGGRVVPPHHPTPHRLPAAERISEMIADADDARRARQARRCRQSRTPAHVTRPDLPRMHAELQPASPNTAVAALPAACRSGPSADGDQGQPDELAFHLTAARR